MPLSPRITGGTLRALAAAGRTPGLRQLVRAGMAPLLNLTPLRQADLGPDVPLFDPAAPPDSDLSEDGE